MCEKPFSNASVASVYEFIAPGIEKKVLVKLCGSWEFLCEF
jgi:hypothetical protein